MFVGKSMTKPTWLATCGNGHDTRATPQLFTCFVDFPITTWPQSSHTHTNTPNHKHPLQHANTHIPAHVLRNGLKEGLALCQGALEDPQRTRDFGEAQQSEEGRVEGKGLPEHFLSSGIGCVAVQRASQTVLPVTNNTSSV